MLKFLNSAPARLVTVLLVAQAALLYSSIRPEIVPPGRALSEFPRQIGSWTMVQEGVINAEAQAVLKADDTLNREYVSAGIGGVNLWIAAFRSQRNGKTPHSPKNCLPGAGWTKQVEGYLNVDVGQAAPIEVNRYIVTLGESSSVVLYWYQSRDRVVASEYNAKFWVIADAIRLNRTDTALVRVIAPIVNHDPDAATRAAVAFVQTIFGTVRQFLPA